MKSPEPQWARLRILSRSYKASRNDLKLCWWKVSLYTRIEIDEQLIAYLGIKLLIGTSTGNLHVHILDDGKDSTEAKVTNSSYRLSKVSKPIESLGFIKDVSSLVVLVDGAVSLFTYPFDGMPKARILPKTRGALCFCVHSAIVRFDEQGVEMKQSETQGVPSVLSTLAVGIRRKIVIYSWKDGEELQVKVRSSIYDPLISITSCRSLYFLTRLELYNSSAIANYLLHTPQLSMSP